MEKEKPILVEVTTKNTGALTMGIISILIGVLALLVGWIPFLGLLAMPAAVIGLLLAFIGIILALLKKFKGILMPFLGGVICSIALIIPILSAGGSSVAISKSIKETSKQMNIESTAKETKEKEEKAEYINTYLDLYDIQAKYMDSMFDGRVPGVLFKLRNRGDRQLDMIEVTVYFKDPNGSIIYEENFHPVLISEFSFTDTKPLKPGYIWQMESGKFYSVKSVPEEWVEGSVEMKITDIRFSKEK